MSTPTHFFECIWENGMHVECFFTWPGEIENVDWKHFSSIREHLVSQTRKLTISPIFGFLLPLGRVQYVSRIWFCLKKRFFQTHSIPISDGLRRKLFQVLLAHPPFCPQTQISLCWKNSDMPRIWQSTRKKVRNKCRILAQHVRRVHGIELFRPANIYRSLVWYRIAMSKRGNSKFLWEKKHLKELWKRRNSVFLTTWKVF